MLEEYQIQQNKETFLDLVKSIEREGVDKERLVRQLEGSDFFEAPASAMYHNAFRGGLCAHSLNVYYNLRNLCHMKYCSVSPEGEVGAYEGPYSEDTIKIVALFHDFDKMNKYERTVKNQKHYWEGGSKYDEMGKYDWESVPGYKRKDEQEVFSIGTHGENSVYMTETFFPLSTEEHAAILNHHSSYDNPNLKVTPLFNKYSLACLLHTADVISTYIDEKI